MYKFRTKSKNVNFNRILRENADVRRPLVVSAKGMEWAAVLLPEAFVKRAKGKIGLPTVMESVRLSPDGETIWGQGTNRTGPGVILLGGRAEAQEKAENLYERLRRLERLRVLVTVEEWPAGEDA